jgi:ParB-like chromosome segregation protein Spo0J
MDEAPKINFKVMETKIVKMSELQPNDYNPNKFCMSTNPNKLGDTSSDMMALLMQNIKKVGFVFPILTTWDEDIKKYRIIDGYHRYEALKRLKSEEAAIIDMKISYHEAIQLTVLMNRIKGFHQVEKMSDLVLKLENLGLTDEEICTNLGMENEEYFRLKQQLGIAHAFRNHEYGKSWEEGKKNE